MDPRTCLCLLLSVAFGNTSRSDPVVVTDHQVSQTLSPNNHDGTGQNVDPCLAKNYRYMRHPERNVNYTLQPGDDTSEGCSIGISRPGWFRVPLDIGGKLLTRCPQPGQCGVERPMWMAPPHPEVSEGVVIRHVCIAHHHCCSRSHYIQVKNCGSFYVYNLKPARCPNTYCTDNLSPCPAGQVSPTGLEPGCQALSIPGSPLATNASKIHAPPRPPPTTTNLASTSTLPAPAPPANVTLSGPVVAHNAFRFTCDVQKTGAPNSNEVMEMQFLFDGAPDPSIPAQRVRPPQMSAVLPGMRLRGHLGQKISCRVRTYYTQTPLKRNNWTISNSYWAGIKVTPPTSVGQGGNTNVSVTSTIPILCSHDHRCCLHFILDVNGPRDKLVVAHPCDQPLCSDRWNATSSSATVTFEVSAAKDAVKDGDKAMTLTFDPLMPEHGGPYLDVFTGYRPKEANVTVNDTDVHMCSWTGDPHFHDFAGTRFDLFEEGDYAVYNTEDFQVHSRVKRCGRAAGCQCGLAIHEAGDVIMIDSCQAAGHAPAVTTNGDLRPGTRVERSRDGRHVMVYLPSGREVKVDSGLSHHNTYLTVPASDGRGPAHGVCGRLVHNGSAVSFPHPDGSLAPNQCIGRKCRPDFVRHWKVNGSASLFESPPRSANQTRETHYCQCDANVRGAPTIDCRPGADVKHPTQMCGSGSCTDVTNQLPSYLGAGGWSDLATHTDEDGVDIEALTSCAAGWEEFEDQCYFFSNYTRSMDDASQDCQMLLPGKANLPNATLAVARNYDVLSFIRSHIKMTNRKSTWIGLRKVFDTESNNTWQWADGTELDGPTFWGKDQPNRPTDHADCVELGECEDFFWNDKTCDREKYFVCQRSRHPLGSTTSPPTAPASPASQKVTESEARDACTAALTSSQLYRTCVTRGVTRTVNVTKLAEELVEDCVDDALAWDSLDMTEAIRHAYTSRCQFLLLRDATSYVTRADGGQALRPELGADLCSEACFTHGTCIRGRCVCEAGFTGDSCKLKSDNLPKIRRMRGRDHCDVTKQPCRSVVFDVDDIEVTSELKCRIAFALEDGTMSNVDGEATFVGGRRLSCAVPDPRSLTPYGKPFNEFRISVTMNGKNFSNEKSLTVFDSTCVDCRNRHSCTYRTDACLIDGRCYRDQARRHGHPAKHCDVARSLADWSTVENGTGVCTAPWVDYANGTSCYLFLNPRTSTSWVHAKEICLANGAHLPEIEDSIENEFVRQHTVDKGGEVAWLGASDLAQHSLWVWSWSGRSLNQTYSNWGPQQPRDRSQQENCLIIGHHSYQWHDYPCSHTFRKPFLIACEKSVDVVF